MADMESYLHLLAEQVRENARRQFRECQQYVGISVLQTENILTVLETNFMKWYPRDIRIHEWLNDDPRYDFNPSEENCHFYRALDLRVMKRDPKNSAIEVGIYTIKNLADFEEYNRLVDRHNDKFGDSLNDSGIDPVSGRSRNMKGVKAYWPVVRTDSPPMPDFHELDELPGTPRPKAKYALAAVIRVSLVIARGKWRIEYMVKNPQGQILAAGCENDADLSEATMRVIQQIFGNHKISTRGDPYAGIHLLLRGAKAKFARTYKGKPAGEMAEDRTGLTAGYYVHLWVERLFRYAIPFVLIPLGIAIAAVGATNIRGPGVPLGALVAIVLPAISVGVSRYFYEIRRGLEAEAEEASGEGEEVDD